MSQRENWQNLNNALSAANHKWRNNDLWDTFALQGRPSPMHQALSAIAFIVDEEPPVATVVDFTVGDDSYETTGFDATVWTDDLVVRARREGGAETPVVSVLPRSALTAFEILRAPIITTSGFESRDERTELRLTYPDQTVTLKSSSGSSLVELIPSFVRDLSAQ